LEDCTSVEEFKEVSRSSGECDYHLPPDWRGRVNLLVGVTFSVGRGVVCAEGVGPVHESDTASCGGLVGNLVCVRRTIANAADSSEGLCQIVIGTLI